MNKVVFKRFIQRWPKPIGDLQTIAAYVTTPSGKHFLVALHEHSTIEGWDSLEIQRLDEHGNFILQEEVPCWIRDRHGDDYFASELFGELTGKYAFQVEEDPAIPVEVITHRNPPRVAIIEERW